RGPPPLSRSLQPRDLAAVVVHTVGASCGVDGLLLGRRMKDDVEQDAILRSIVRLSEMEPVRNLGHRRRPE
ncbi:MAG: hypothetical protein NZP34_07405, partial [Caldilineales bacterium]|nr:hypothetical protein [Caldilineales bacterium]